MFAIAVHRLSPPTPVRALLLLVLLVGLMAGRSITAAASDPGFHAVECEGEYVQHLQGVCTDQREAIFWSWTDKLVKTDRNGKILREKSVAYHHGDLCFRAGRIYVAVNLGKFNELPGQENSWVYVYDAETLAEVARHPVPELVYGAGGMSTHGDAFVVIGGLPPSASENYIYEYDLDFHFRKRSAIPGYTYKGIQTAAYADGAWWFATYGDIRYLFKTDGDFKVLNRWVADAALGIMPIGEGRFLIGRDELSGKRHHGWVEVAHVDAKAGLVIDALPVGHVAAGAAIKSPAEDPTPDSTRAGQIRR